MIRRVPISVSQLCELIGVDPIQFRGLEAAKMAVNAEGGISYLAPPVLLIEEPDHEHERHVPAALEGR